MRASWDWPHPDDERYVMDDDSRVDETWENLRDLTRDGLVLGLTEDQIRTCVEQGIESFKRELEMRR